MAVSKNCVNPPSLVMLAVPAVLVFMKFVNPPLLVMVAVSAVLVFKKFVVPPPMLLIADPGGVRIENIKRIIVEHGANDRTFCASVAELERAS